MIHCARCKVTSDKEKLNKYNSTSYMCNPCNTARLKKYRRTSNGKKAVLRAVNSYEHRNPKRRVAWEKAKRITLQPCEVCGDNNAHRHHPNIDEPLKVVFLCPLHHKEAHLSVV